MIKQENLQAYVNLIEGLLSCPQGEEWILLRQNQELVNQELVEVMEQIAHHFTVEGDFKAAKYLHNWAGKLHHILTERIPFQQNADLNNAYIELIQALLSCPEGSQAAILAKHQELIDPKLVKIMKEVAVRLENQGDQETAAYLNNLAADLNRTWLQKHQFEPTLKKELAPDPWLEEDSDDADSATETTVPQPDSLPTSSSDRSREHQEVREPQSQQITEPQLAQQLKTIADLLTQLAATFAAKSQSLSPLWYMDELEKALANDWLLSTDEVEQLIGIKPHCDHDKNSFDRGSWVFTKAGKVGAQTAWKVSKLVNG